MRAWFLGVKDDVEAAQRDKPPAAVENGPVRSTTRAEHRWGASTFSTAVSAHASEELVEVRVANDWQARDPSITQAMATLRSPETHTTI